MEKYLFLYLKTGNGHLAPAKAVAEKIRNSRRRKVDILLYDGLTEANDSLRKILEDGYRQSVNRAVWIFEFLYALHKFSIIARLTTTIVTYFLIPSIENRIIKEKPAKIILFHFFLIKPVYYVIEKHGLDIPVITVVTDPFTAHPVWFLKKNQHFIVFSEILKEKCIARGIEPENLRVFPFVTEKKFSAKAGKFRQIEIRRQLGFKPDSKVVLIIGGGDGMPRGKRILKRIIRDNVDAEIAIVCGNNSEMFSHVSRMKEKYKLNSPDIKIYGFIDFVHSLITISDVVITKCGASTFMEILLLGKIPLINNYIWEQEKGNMEFVRDSRMGIYEKRTSHIPGLLNKLLNDNEYYNSLAGNIRKASIRNGVGAVSDYILNYQH